MRLDEVSLRTDQVVRLARFYRTLLKLDTECDDCDNDVHQFILTEGTTLTIYNDGLRRSDNQHYISLAFTVDDLDSEYERLLALQIEIISPPTLQPWGAKNMVFTDPDGNQLIMRSFPA